MKYEEEDSKVFESMYEVIASGFIADELPSDLTQKFLTALKL
jgi:hypothetical protein